MRRYVPAKVHRPLRQHQLVQVANAPRIAVRLCKVEKMNVGGQLELAHDRPRSCVPHQEHRIDAPGQQRVGGIASVQIHQGGCAA